MKMPNRYRAMCAQGRIPELFDLLKSESTTSERTKMFASKYEKRFFQNPPRLRLRTKDVFIRQVMRVYQEYFIQVLTRKSTPQDAEVQLVHQLSKVLGTDFPDMESVEQRLEAEFLERGYNFIGGTTGPIYGPYVWKQTTTQTYAVDIPNWTQELNIHFMDGFIMESWLHFASFGSVRSGGWAREDGLYCVYSAYRDSLSTEEFTVSFLKHEAQHVVDFAMFPKLISRDLEYRAKLVELIYTSTQKLFLGFLMYADNDPQNSHVYAAYSIVKHLSRKVFDEEYTTDIKRWQSISVEQIQALARALYDEHTALLQEYGSDVVEGIV